MTAVPVSLDDKADKGNEADDNYGEGMTKLAWSSLSNKKTRAFLMIMIMAPMETEECHS